MPQESTLLAGLETFEEVFRATSPGSLVSQLQSAFRAVLQMSADECIIAAQTLSALAAMDDRYCRHPAILSLANAIRERMLACYESAIKLGPQAELGTERRFLDAWGTRAGTRFACLPSLRTRISSL